MSINHKILCVRMMFFTCTLHALSIVMHLTVRYRRAKYSMCAIKCCLLQSNALHVALHLRTIIVVIFLIGIVAKNCWEFEYDEC